MTPRPGRRRRRPPRRPALAVATLALVATVAACTPLVRAGATPARGLRVTFLAETSIPAGATLDETCVGGLSALAGPTAGGPDGDLYWAPSDSRLDARLYGLRIAVDEQGEAPRLAMAVERVTRLHSRLGEPYPDGRTDPEGLAAVRPDAAWLSTDGVTTSGVPPVIDLVDLETGEWLMSAPVPEAFRPRDTPTGAVGIRYNLGFEALTVTPAGAFLVAATEAPLEQDPDPETPGAESFARLLVYRLGETPSLVAEGRYPLRRPDGDLVVHGLSELLALDTDGRFLALERSFIRGRGFVNRLFEVRLPAPLAALAAAPATAEPVVATKRLVVDFADLGLPLQNYEALAFGPRLRDGSATLLVLADNDKPACPPRVDHIAILPTRLLLFRLET